MPNNSKELDISPAQYAELISDIFSEVMENLLTPESLEKVCGEEITPTQFEVLRFIYRHNKKMPYHQISQWFIHQPAGCNQVCRPIGISQMGRPGARFGRWSDLVRAADSQGNECSGNGKKIPHESHRRYWQPDGIKVSICTGD